MPPPAVRTIRDLLYWQYAKIIAGSAGMGKKQRPFIIDGFRRLVKDWDARPLTSNKRHEVLGGFG